MPWRGTCAVTHEPGVAAWLRGQGWPLSPMAGQLGTQGVEGHEWGAEAVLGRAASPREMDRVWALPSCEDDAWWQSQQEDCWRMNLPQRIFVKKIVGKGDFDKLQILKMIKESLTSSVI